MAHEIGRRIAIIGAGFSGSLLAVHLLRRSSPRDRIYLIERDAAFGRGLAYGTGNPHHLLNVRAGNMSAFSDRPDHFLDWIRALPEEERAVVSVTEDRLTFVPRRLYGSYVQSILAREIRTAEGSQRLYLVADEAVALHRREDGYAVETGCGRLYEVDAVALATGNLPAAEAPGYATNPWDPAALDNLDPDADLLLVGTGLTMVNVVISLLDRRHRGSILAISRRGLLPRTHAATTPLPRILPAADAPRSVLGLLMRLRREIRRHATSGRDWRAVINSLRPDTQAIWRQLPIEEKRRFLRHLRPWWDVHRHRMAPGVAARIERARERGQLVVQRARLGALEPRGKSLAVRIRPVGGGPEREILVGRVVDCSGPLGAFSKAASPLLQGLLQSGDLRPDPLDLGLDVTAEGAAIDREGQPSRRLFALGPLTKGVFWETTAVPDIRVQCERLAERILALVETEAGEPVFS